MRNKLERFDEVGIVDETNGFGLEFFKKTENGFLRVVGAVLWIETNLRSSSDSIRRPSLGCNLSVRILLDLT